MFKKLINQFISNLFFYEIPTRSNSFSVQKKLFKRLLSQYQASPLYQILWIKQDKTMQDIVSYDEFNLKKYIAQYHFCDYQNHILPFCLANEWITVNQSDLFIKTSGTSDSNSGGKLIPSQWKSFDNERTWIKRTLACYLKENQLSNIFFTRSFWLTAPFDEWSKTWYVSGAMRYANKKFSYTMFPSNNILAISDWNQKKSKILEELIDKQIFIWSVHWVPTWPLDIIQDLIDYNKWIATKILQKFEYVSVGWWPALDYKKSFQNKLQNLWLSQNIYGSNNHNASEWFLWSQVRNFSNLNYHWMSPVMQTNFFLFVPILYFDSYNTGEIGYSDMIMKSHLLHEVEYGIEYIMLFANHRIPRLYNIKDKVIFQKNDNFSHHDSILEYNVTWRYGMASNIFNEHIEVEHLFFVIDSLIKDWYQFDRNAFVAGMELIENQWIFYIILESNTLSYDGEELKQKFDLYLSQVNEQWKLFRQRDKIKDLYIIVQSISSLRKALIDIRKMHEQSKIPHLSDKNFDVIIAPLLWYFKKE